jgi:FkbM family methyltransferase
MTKKNIEKKINLHEFLDKFLLKESFYEVIKKQFQEYLFRKMTKKSCALFLRASDLISASPQLFGLWEPEITSLIEYCAKHGNNDFLLDIGANIGLISCQTGQNFKEIHMFEPNPLCCKVLEVNSQITLTNSTYKIYPIGLGEHDRDVVLTVPRENWGGAFIKNEQNMYNSDTLAKKDGYIDLKDENYFKVDIKIKDAGNILEDVFKRLSNLNLQSGVIKIDVEGYEKVILKAIAEVLPVDINVIIIFESWDSNLNIEELVNDFQGRATARKLLKKYPWKKRWPKLIKFATLIFKSTIENKIEEIEIKACDGDIILLVDKIRSI